MNALFSLLLMHAITGPTMTQDQQAVDLQVNRLGDQIEVQLHGLSDRTQQIAFTIEVSGNSRSKHRGRTTLTANAPQVLSTIKINASNDWCAKVKVEEENRAPYELVEGACP